MGSVLQESSFGGFLNFFYIREVKKCSKYNLKQDACENPAVNPEGLLPLSCFNKNKSTTDGLQTFCRHCQSRYDIKRKEKKRVYNSLKYQTPEELSRQYKRRGYKLNGEWLTYSKVIEILEKQENKCSCCGGNLKFYYIDHNHDTGEFRGLLCSNCNVGIGKLGDCIEGIEKALKYLKDVSK